VAFSCPLLDEFRQQHTDISLFKTMCKLQGIYPTLAFKWYVNGLHWDGNPVYLTAYRNRGSMLAKVRDRWLQLTWPMVSNLDARTIKSLTLSSLRCVFFNSFSNFSQFLFWLSLSKGIASTYVLYLIWYCKRYQYVFFQKRVDKLHINSYGYELSFHFVYCWNVIFLDPSQGYQFSEVSQFFGI